MTTRYKSVEIIAGGGLYGTNNQAKIPPGGLIVSDSVTLSEGGFKKEGGSDRFNSTVLATGVSIIGGINWYPSTDAPRQIVAASNGKIYRATGTTTGAFSEIATGLDTNASHTVFVTAGAESIGQNRKLFLLNGKNQVRYIDGDASAVSTVSIPASDWSDTASGAPSFGFLHANRLFVGGNQNDPHRLYYSSASSHLELSATGAGDAGTLAIYPGDGQKLVAGVSFKGYAVAWKYPSGIYYIDSSSATISEWTVQRITNNVGIAGPNAYCVVENDVVFMDAAGNFHTFSLIDATSKEVSNISSAANFAEWMRNNVDMSKISSARMAYHPNRREIHCALASIGSTVNSLRVIIDLNANGPRFRYSYKDVCQSMWTTIDENSLEVPACGDDAGGVWILDRETYNRGGDGYTSEFRTAYTDLSYADPILSTVRKNLGWLELIVNPTGDYDLNITVHIDGRESQTIAFNMGTTGSALGSFVLGTDQLSGEYLTNVRKRLTGSGQFISISGKNSAADEDFDVSTMLLYFSPGSDRKANG